MRDIYSVNVFCFGILVFRVGFYRGVRIGLDFFLKLGKIEDFLFF